MEVLMKPKFKGWYYKQQVNGKTLAIIPGKSSNCAFIFVITDAASFHIKYDLSEFIDGEVVCIGKNTFSHKGIKLNITHGSFSIIGELKYSNLTPINSDIMGPFRFFPMECRHGIISMRHNVSGKVKLNGQIWDFENGGIGYIETDSGVSFPEKYTWVQSNNFVDTNATCSIMAAIAKIPFAGFHFWGCICVIMKNGKEYRLTTYKGVKIIKCKHNSIELAQGKYRLRIKVNQQAPQKLPAPKNGIMSRVIKESAACPAKFHFTENGRTIIYGESLYTSYEYC